VGSRRSSRRYLYTRGRAYNVWGDEWVKAPPLMKRSPEIEDCGKVDGTERETNAIYLAFVHSKGSYIFCARDGVACGTKHRVRKSQKPDAPRDEFGSTRRTDDAHRTNWLPLFPLEKHTYTSPKRAYRATLSLLRV